jgi:hypothetical protein
MATDSAPALLFVATDLDPADEAAVNRWYDERHVPQRQALPGFRTARRYVAFSGSPKYAALYDMDSPDALKSDAYKALSQAPIQTEQDREMVSKFKNNLRGVMTQILSAGAETAPSQDVAKALLCVGLEPEPAYEEEYNAWYNDEHIPFLIKVPGVLRARRFRALEGGPKYLAVYELTEPGVRQSAPFSAAADTPWSARIRPHCNRAITAIYQPLPVPATQRG